MGTWFPALFAGGDPAGHAARLRSESAMTSPPSDQHGRPIYVDISLAARTSRAARLLDISRDNHPPPGNEQQLIQASKMATLGEMSTGVAHELNQPLSVIRTISGFFMRKLRKKEPMDEKTFILMAEGIDQNVERAARIIEHMREFGRKSGLKLERVRLDAVLRKAFDIFEQQFRVRGIVRVGNWPKACLPCWPSPTAGAGVHQPAHQRPRRIEERARRRRGRHRAPAPSGPPVRAPPRTPTPKPRPGRGRLRTMVPDGRVIMEVEDTGTGFPPASPRTSSCPSSPPRK